MTVNLTDGGRIRKLSAVRQRRVIAKKRKATHRSLRVPIQTAKDLDTLAKQIGGMPLTKLLGALTAVAASDAKLRDKVFRVGIALNTRPATQAFTFSIRLFELNHRLATR